MLDTVRFLAGFSWLICFLFLSGSIVRLFLKRENFKDRQWVICWFFAMLMSGYFLRLVFGLAPQPEPGTSYTVTLGLQFLSLLIALRILHIRIDIQGFKW